MARKRVFISFDYKNDAGLRDSLVEQSRRPDSPFSMVYCPARVPYDEHWKHKTRSILRDMSTYSRCSGGTSWSATGAA